MIFTSGTILLCALALTNKFSKRQITLISLLFLVIVAVIYKPDSGMDLYRHYQMLDLFAKYGLENTIMTNMDRMGTLPLYALFFYFISLFHYNQLLLAFTYILVYSAQFKVLSMYVNDNGYDKKSWMIGYSLIMLTTNAYGLTGIRNFLAFAITEVFLYIDLCRREHRKLSMVIYFSMCLLHDSIILILAFRLMVYVIEKFRTVSQNVILFLILVSPIMIKGMGTFLRTTPISFLKAVGNKILTYGGTDGINSYGGDAGTEIRATMGLIILMLVVFCIKATLNKEYYQRSDIKMLVIITLFCFGGMIGNRVLVERYITMGVMFAIPTMVKVIREGCPQSGYYIKTNAIPLITMVCILFSNICYWQYRFFI